MFTQQASGSDMTAAISSCFRRRRCSKFPFKGRLEAVLYTGWARTFSNGPTVPRDQYDVVIAGGGVMGCSSAYFLARRIPGHSVCIIERDTKVLCACFLLCVCGFGEFVNRLEGEQIVSLFGYVCRDFDWPDPFGQIPCRVHVAL